MCISFLVSGSTVLGGSLRGSADRPCCLGQLLFGLCSCAGSLCVMQRVCQVLPRIILVHILRQKRNEERASAGAAPRPPL